MNRTPHTAPRSAIHGARQEVRASRAGECRVCKRPVRVGDFIFYFPRSKKVEHLNCTRGRAATRRPTDKPTRRRACPVHGWVNAVQSDDSQWMCPIDGLNAMTERQYQLLLAERNTRRLQGTGG
jgi:hypothetical protein